MIFENHHEPIIDIQTWERVQEFANSANAQTAMMKWGCSPDTVLRGLRM